MAGLFDIEIEMDAAGGADATVQDGTDEAVSGTGSEGLMPLDGSVTTPKLAGGAVTTDKLADGAVSGAKVRNYTITDDKLDPTGVVWRVQQLADTLDRMDVSIDPDDLGLEQDDDTKIVYPTYRGVRSVNGIPLAASGGGGGGGGSMNAAVLTVTNTTGWLSTSVTEGAAVTLSLSWSSVEDDVPTGDGTLTVTANNAQVLSRNVSQGTVTIDATPYLARGANKVKVRVTDVYDNARVITFSVAVVSLYVASGFDTGGTFPADTPIDYTYIPVGAVEKSMSFEVDGTVVATSTVAASGMQQHQTIPALSHGSHVLRVWFTATVDGALVTSNVLTHALVVVSSSSKVPIVSSTFSQAAARQYETLLIPYRAYNPQSLSAQVTLVANGVTVGTITVDRTDQVWAYRCDRAGAVTLAIRCGTTQKTFAVTVAASEADLEPVTQGLALHLSAVGRSNGEEHPEVWEDADNDVSCTLTGFSFTTDGWVTGADGSTCLRVARGATVTIPYQPFAADWRSTGKTIELEFATRDVADYGTAVISCVSGGRGLTVTPQLATLASEQSEVSMRYKEGEHVRLAFVGDTRGDGRLLRIYVNGIMSKVIQYPDADDFSQLTPVGITISSTGCTVDVYHIRAYDHALTRRDVLRNWIADSPTVDVMLDRHSHNDVYDEYGQIVIDHLPNDLPYMIISCAELPQYKGDKKTVGVTFVDPQSEAKSFTATGVQANVQGTSSAVYVRKNYDLQFKQGFEMASGSHAATYQLDTTIKPNDRFVLKADVASSEGANNVELVKLYCDADPYRRPEEQADPLVRKGIWGRPIALFWHDTATNTTSFLGKANFNLPKRAPVPYGYTGDMESWEFQNNTSNLMLFLTDTFDETMVTDPTTGDAKEAWRYDYEARFPSDEWTDYAKLQELQSFVYSTYRANATGDALAETYTDVDGNTHTVDNAAYRLAKFRTEFGQYAEVQSFIFYYIFTELFLMVDSRAKNLFIGFSGSDTTGLTAIDRKAVAEPYDMDTAIGINNEGELVFGYSLEDTDHLTGGANVYNGQDSVLWNNLRDAFPTEIVQAYQALRSAGALSYATVEQRFEEHQARWPEAIYNEDAQFKYIDPLLNPDSGSEPTDSYLGMAQGSKAEQRKWWLYNRFRYLDSKWNAGDALTDIIELRGYAKANITVTPYADIYPTVRYGTPVVSTRGVAGTPYTLACPLDSLNDTEIHIFSASQLSSVGDLSGLKVGRADFSRATKLTSIKVGDGTSGYTNANLAWLNIGNLPLLQSVDARNCTNLTGTVDVSGATGLVHAYFAGTAITGLALPQGGTLRTLQLPSTVTSLTVRDQPNIETFTLADYSGITTLHVEGCGDAIPYMDILEDMAAGSRVRIVGLEVTVSATSDVEDLYDLLDTMRGLDESDNTTETAQVSGTITGLGTITGAWYAEMTARYPSVTLGYEHINSTLTYKSYDGSTTIYTETVADGGNGAYSGTPSRNSSAQYDYTFVGWSLEQDQITADANATTGVVGTRTVYAAYSTSVRTYTVTWKNKGGTTLETDQNVPYGTVPTYDGATPTYDGQTSVGWTPEVSAVTGDTVYTASYAVTYTITWEDSDGTTLATTSAQEGTVPTYTGETPSGSVLPFFGWTPTPVAATEDTTYTATYRSNSKTVQYLDGSITEYEGAVTNVKDNAFDECLSLTTVDLTATAAVTIGTDAFTSSSNLAHLVIRSQSMASLSNAAAISGRIMTRNGAVYVPAGLVDTYKADSLWGLYPIKPISEYPASDFASIADSWAQIIASAQGGTAGARYAVGDTKMLDLGTEGEICVHVAQVDSGGITFVSKVTLANTKRMNPSNSSGTQGTGANGGWEHCEMRTYLNTTILALLPAELQAAVKTVTKYSDNVVDGASTITHDGCVTQDKLWLLSAQEVFGGASYETQGAQYSDLLSDDSHRTVYTQGGARTSWWLRSAASKTSFRGVNNRGVIESSSPTASNNRGVVFGFCI